ncbi:MAG: type II toxin-antitoxin system HicA family toxin [Bacteroidales bacterium]|nr:type II toxin-antitoxin system HicA family toxin [Bacteroidales bacterium]
MSKIPSFTPKEIVKILLKNGFVQDRIKGSHFIYFNKNTGKRVVVPVHKKDLPKGTFWAIIKSAGLNLKDL